MKSFCVCYMADCNIVLKVYVFVIWQSPTSYEKFMFMLYGRGRHLMKSLSLCNMVERDIVCKVYLHVIWQSATSYEK